MIIPYCEHDHGTFDEEWNPHYGVNDWWYATGYLRENGHPQNLYSYQFTLVNPRRFGKVFYMLDTAFSDMQTGEHFFERKIRLAGKKTGIFQEVVTFLPFGLLQKRNEQMMVTTKTKVLELDLNLQSGKGAFWHCDNGLLIMGVPDDPKQRSVYYSYTNMPTTGTVKLTNNAGHMREFSVSGKSWFDRQWGPFRLLDTNSYWEWFSIRFFDDEEVMLFAFPQHSYYDGTYIDKDGRTKRIRDYHYDFHSLMKRNKLVFSYGWDIVLPGVKEEYYRITPLHDGQYNSGYFEIMSSVTNLDNKEVGYSFVELMPGLRHTGKKLRTLDLFLYH